MAHIQVAYEEYYCHVGDVPVRLLIQEHREAERCTELGILAKRLRKTLQNSLVLQKGTTKVLEKYKVEPPGKY
jgi:hypothetical protein